MNQFTTNVYIPKGYPCEFPTQFVGGCSNPFIRNDDTKAETPTPSVVKVTMGGSVFMANPFTDKKVSSVDLSINGYVVNVETRTHAVYITGATCHSCCDSDCSEEEEENGVKTSSKYARHTLSSVFNKLEELGQLPDPSKILDLWYINRHKNEELQAEGEAKNDEWWFRYLKEHYEKVQFVSCTMFDEEKIYGLYTKKGLL